MELWHAIDQAIRIFETIRTEAVTNRYNDTMIMWSKLSGARSMTNYHGRAALKTRNQYVQTVKEGQSFVLDYIWCVYCLMHELEPYTPLAAGLGESAHQLYKKVKAINL